MRPDGTFDSDAYFKANNGPEFWGPEPETEQIVEAHIIGPDGKEYVRRHHFKGKQNLKKQQSQAFPEDDFSDQGFKQKAEEQRRRKQ